MARFLTASLLSVFLLACSSSSTTPTTPKIASTAAIWFQPDPVAGTSPNWGSVDYFQLFQNNAEWPTTLAHTQVIGLYSGWIANLDDADLTQLIGFLNAHNLAIELEAPSLQGTATCGSGMEGFVAYPQTVQANAASYLSRLFALHANVAYIKVDEPFYFGGVAPDARSCHLTPTQMATQVGYYVQLVHGVYPNAQVGDVEPVFASNSGNYPIDTADAIGQWHLTYQSVTGTAFPFYFADIDWTNTDWPQLVKTLETQSRQQGLKFGIIYLGDMDDTTDQEWTSKASARFQLYQGQSGGNPDYVLFQSWEPHPQHCLPETDPTTFTGLLKTYVDATTP